MRFFQSLIFLGLAACAGSEFTTASGGHAGTGGVRTGGSSGGSMGGNRDGAVDARLNTGGGAPDAAPRNSGDCDTKDDCGGDPCVELVPGGYRVCISPVPEATMCSVPAGTCCQSSECTVSGSKCVLGPAQPSCGGPLVVPTNVCVTDACKKATDCSGANAVCQPPGMLGAKAGRCVNGGCLYDRDCTGAGVSCAPIVDSCCKAFAGLYCVYPDGCRRDSDCPATQHCAPVPGTNRTGCMPGAAVCPAAAN